MELQSISASARVRTRRFIACAQCGEPIYVAAWSEHVDDRRVRHLWECDACGYAFETLACFPAR
jgi:Zn ribbon nucleic-acid-binding protein